MKEGEEVMRMNHWLCLLASCAFATLSFAGNGGQNVAPRAPQAAPAPKTPPAPAQPVPKSPAQPPASTHDHPVAPSQPAPAHDHPTPAPPTHVDPRPGNDDHAPVRPPDGYHPGPHPVPVPPAVLPGHDHYGLPGHDHHFPGYNHWYAPYYIDPYGIPYGPYNPYGIPYGTPLIPGYTLPAIPAESVGQVVRQVPRAVVAGQVFPVDLLVTLPPGATFGRLGLIENMPPGFVVVRTDPVAVEPENRPNKAVWRVPNVSGSFKLTAYVIATGNDVGWQHFSGVWKLEGARLLPIGGDDVLWLGPNAPEQLAPPVPVQETPSPQ